MTDAPAPPPSAQRHPATPATTSPQRTYRYLRIATALTVVAIFTAVLAAVPFVGWLPSISHYYDSPARTVFTGALIAAAVCLFALSGRGASRALLDAAALFAPLVAIIPFSDVTADPATVFADVRVGLTAYLVVGALVVGIGAALTARGEIDPREAGLSLGLGGGILLIVGVGWMLAPGVVLAVGHVIAAVVFFALIAATALLEAFRPATGATAPWLRTAYAVLGSSLAAVLVATLALSGERFYAWRPVLIGESIALLLFAAFWVLQTAQNWRDRDPSLR